MNDAGRLREFRAGHAEVRQGATGQWSLWIGPTPSGYSDAQIDDYHGLPRSRFPWRPPVHLLLRARVDPDSPLGTFGFGFWNDPFSLALGQAGAGWRLPTLPRAVWFFFGSPPNEFSFAPEQHGSGWRAMSLDSPRIPAPLLAPGALAGLVMLKTPGLRRMAFRAAQRMVRASEAHLTFDPHSWHEYDLVWRHNQALFRVDGTLVLEASAPPKGPLGFVAWIDNQFAMLSPQAGIRFGVIPTAAAQSLEIERLSMRKEDGP